MMNRIHVPKLALAAILTGALALAALACGGGDNGSGNPGDANGGNGGNGANGGGDERIEERIAVLASTSIVADLVEQVGGERVDVSTAVPVGGDPHTFAATPGLIRRASEADLLVVVGSSLARIEDDLARSTDGAVLTLTDGMDLRPFPEALAHDDHADEDDHAHDEDGDDHADEDDHAHDEDGDDHADEDDHAHDEDGNDHADEDGDDHADEDGDDHTDEDGDDHADEDGDDHADEDGDDHADEDGDDHADEDGDDHADEDDHGHDEDGDDHADEDDHGHDDEDDHGHDEEDGHHGHDHGSVDPHFWMDIDFVIEAVEAIRAQLARLDPAGADDYRERADAYAAELRALDGEIADTLADLPEERRYLVTFHDAYGYFAERYGLTILGFVVEGPEEEPAAGAIAELVERIEALDVPFIFTEPQFSARPIEQVARDSGAAVRTIPSGSLAEEYPSYVEFLRAIARGIAD